MRNSYYFKTITFYIIIEIQAQLCQQDTYLHDFLGNNLGNELNSKQQFQILMNSAVYQFRNQVEEKINIKHEVLNELKEIQKLILKNYNEDGINENINQIRHNEAKNGMYGFMQLYMSNTKRDHLHWKLKGVKVKGSYRIVSGRYGYKYQDGRDMSGLQTVQLFQVLNNKEKVAVNIRDDIFIIHYILHPEFDWFIMLQETKNNSQFYQSFSFYQLIYQVNIFVNNFTLLELGVKITKDYQLFNNFNPLLLFITYAKDKNYINTILNRTNEKGDEINDQMMKITIQSYLFIIVILMAIIFVYPRYGYFKNKYSVTQI